MFPDAALVAIDQPGLFGNVHHGFLQRSKILEGDGVDRRPVAPIGHDAFVEGLERGDVLLGKQVLPTFLHQPFRPVSGHPFHEVIDFHPQGCEDFLQPLDGRQHIQRAIGVHPQPGLMQQQVHGTIHRPRQPGFHPTGGGGLILDHARAVGLPVQVQQRRMMIGNRLAQLQAHALA